MCHAMLCDLNHSFIQCVPIINENVLIKQVKPHTFLHISNQNHDDKLIDIYNQGHKYINAHQN